jgi:hypothetical protein
VTRAEQLRSISLRAAIDCVRSGVVSNVAGRVAGLLARDEVVVVNFNGPTVNRREDWN